jgi:hypothetical protein
MESDSQKITIIDPKNKDGHPMLGVTIIHYPDNKTSKWYVNGERYNPSRLSSLLNYKSKDQFLRYIKKYGLINLLENGINNLSV